jgi:hypothetical protein
LKTGKTADGFASISDFGQTLESMQSKLLKEGFKEINSKLVKKELKWFWNSFYKQI